MTAPFSIRVPFDDARDVVDDRGRSLSPAGAFVWELHAAAVKRWFGHSGELLAVALLRDGELERLRTPLIEDYDILAPLLIGLADDHLRRTRPEMAPMHRRRLAGRAARVVVLRLGFAETYEQIAARSEVGCSLRSVKSAYALLIDAYLAGWRQQRLPPPIVPVALSAPRSR